MLSAYPGEKAMLSASLPDEFEVRRSAMADLQRTVGEVIRRERRNRRLTLKDLAERAIISVVYLGEIERGKKYPSPVVLERLAGALELEVSDLLELVAIEMRGPQPQMLRAIGFSQSARTSAAPTGGRVINLLDAVAVA
jgi:transcriptional regulator with XRE-family HTH domain